MTWLSGRPKTIIPLRWPANDPRVEISRRGQIAHKLTPSILNDQILYTIVQREPPISFVYLAPVYEAVANNQQSVTFKVRAVLPYTVHSVALLTQRTGFASLTYDKQCVYNRLILYPFLRVIRLDTSPSLYEFMPGTVWLWTKRLLTQKRLMVAS